MTRPYSALTAVFHISKSLYCVDLLQYTLFNPTSGVGSLFRLIAFCDLLTIYCASYLATQVITYPCAPFADAVHRVLLIAILLHHFHFLTNFSNPLLRTISHRMVHYRIDIKPNFKSSSILYTKSVLNTSNFYVYESY